YYESLAGSAAAPAELLAGSDPAAELFKRAVRLLVQTQGDAWVSQSAVWHMIKRLDATFDPQEHGHANFLAMRKAFDAWVEAKDGACETLVRLR
ncbi:MAG: OST-HTH/LOTUS domain-containing protein, partial [Lacisediminimonas sp.]|nr:OST-HTH/LOTUS domain-containing protein [Lacisediminimonas sp.]